MSRLFSLMRRHLAGSGMLLALLLLCGFFSVATWTEQHPLGAEAARGLAAQARPHGRALVVVRAQPEEAAFADLVRQELAARGVSVAEVVKGEPKDARAALQRAAASGGADVILCSHAAAAWLVFSDLPANFPALKDARVLTAAPKAWPNSSRRTTC